MMTKADAVAKAKKLTKTQRAALAKLIVQVRAGERSDLSTSGIRRDTLRALERAGYIRRDNLRVWTERNYRSGRQHVNATWNTAWNVGA